MNTKFGPEPEWEQREGAAKRFGRLIRERAAVPHRVPLSPETDGCREFIPPDDSQLGVDPL